MPNETSENITIYNDSGIIKFGNSQVTLRYDTAAGFYNISFDALDVSSIYARCLLSDGRELVSTAYDQRTYVSEAVEDGFGRGIKLSVINSSVSLPEMTQNFTLYEDKSFILLEVSLSNESTLSSNYMAPAISEIRTNERLTRYMFVPYDNDMWIRFGSYELYEKRESYEVSALYDNETRNGLILGSIRHDKWKTGVAFTEAGFSAYGGITSASTRDTLPHGNVSGTKIASPLIFMGYYDDYREGMSAYAKANTIIKPALPWDEGVIFGWNSWSAVGDKLDYQSYVNASDFLHKNVQENFHNADGSLYINFDSFWDRLTEAQTQAALKTVRDNGQRPGWYWTPFTFWGSDYRRAVEGAPGYTYGDIVLRDYEGNILPAIDGGIAIDPTHPAAIARIDYMLSKFRSMGYRYIKFDFMAHGALEGKHYTEMTGIEAYNFGMAHIAELLKYDDNQDSIFIDLSISPLFPYEYAHSRRMSCDVFASISDSEYLLNALTYGWWINGSLYAFNDPDHIVLTKSYSRAASTREEARTRMNAAVICGGVMVVSDNYNFGYDNGSENIGSEEAQQRAIALLNNTEINNLAGKGKSFVPVEGNTGERACSQFVLIDGEERYLAVFNYAARQKEIVVDMERAGFGSGEFTLRDLWDGTITSVRGEVSIPLEPCQSFIYRVE